jgi:hypothetical protein
MRKDNFKLSIIISLLVVISLSATYAYMEMSASNNSSTGTAGCFEVNYSGQSIDNSSLKSTKDYTEGATSNIILSKNQDCEIYTEASIIIHTNSDITDAPLSNGAMKYKIMQGTTEISSGSIAAVDANSEDQILAIVPLTETNVTYTVYLWIDPEISRGSYHEKIYSGYLYARSTQSSTVTGT